MQRRGMGGGANDSRHGARPCCSVRSTGSNVLISILERKNLFQHLLHPHRRSSVQYESCSKLVMYGAQLATLVNDVGHHGQPRN